MSLQLYVKQDEQFIAVGSLNQDTTVRAVSKVLISDAIENYIKKFSPKKNKQTCTNEKTYFSKLHGFLISKGVVYVHEVKSHHMESYQEFLLSTVSTKTGKLISPNTVKRQFNTLKHFFNETLTRAENPCSKLDIEEAPKATKELWTEDDFHKAKAHIDPRFANLVEFVWITGARNIEAINLTWDDINWAGGYLVLKCRKGKKGMLQIRQYPLLPKLMILLSKINRIEGNPNVFGCGLKLTSDVICKKMRKAVEAAFPGDQRKIRLYGMRHTFCKDLLQSEKQFTRAQIQKFMGHKDWRTTEQYAHWEINYLSAALESVR